MLISFRENLGFCTDTVERCDNAARRFEWRPSVDGCLTVDEPLYRLRVFDPEYIGIVKILVASLSAET